MTNVVGAILFAGVVLYAIFGGADFGAGFWDLTAGGAERGRRPRVLIDLSIGPVWEANHVWLIFCLVVAWSAFPPAFAAVMRTLYVPLGLAALGIVLRGSGFAFRKVSVRTAAQRANGAAFAVSSVVTPFFLGTVAGSIAAGRVSLTGASNGFSVWVTPTSLFTGALAVATCAYLAAVFLLVAVGAYSGSHRYLYPVLPSLALLAAVTLDRNPAPTRLIAVGASAILAVAYLPVFASFALDNQGLIAAGRAASGSRGVLLTDSPVVAFYSGKSPADITGSQSLPLDPDQAAANPGQVPGDVRHVSIVRRRPHHHRLRRPGLLSRAGGRAAPARGCR